MTKLSVLMTESTSLNPERIPPPAELERVCKAMAMLDAILSPEFEFRYYSYNCHWDDALSQRVGSMQNGSGDEYFILFEPAGVICKGYAHERRKSPEQVARLYARVPSHFGYFLTEPAFETENATFCFWHEGRWERSEEGEEGVDDGSMGQLRILTEGAEGYKRYADGYYLTEVPLETVQQIFRLAPLTKELIERLNPEVSIEQLADDIAEIGYPLVESE
jgi:hypothetical protein